jgi:transcriptional regulator with XRE-family HTH domain
MALQIGDNMRVARAARGLSQAALARLLNVSQTQVWRWESGRIPRADRLCQIADVLRVTLDELAFGLRRARRAKK